MLHTHTLQLLSKYFSIRFIISSSATALTYRPCGVRGCHAGSVHLLTALQCVVWHTGDGTAWCAHRDVSPACDQRQGKRHVRTCRKRPHRDGTQRRSIEIRGSSHLMQQTAASDSCIGNTIHRRYLPSQISILRHVSSIEIDTNIPDYAAQANSGTSTLFIAFQAHVRG